jgi:prepilin peptidase CpaA
MTAFVPFLPLLIAILVLVAAWRDVASRIIPDTLCALIALGGFMLRCAEGLVPALASLGAALGLFLLLLPAAARGALGGGDVKLAAALLIGLPPPVAGDFIFITVMLGGGLGLAYLAGPRLISTVRTPQPGAPLLLRVLRVERWRLRRGGPLPYAVAIALGAIIVHLFPARS